MPGLTAPRLPASPGCPPAGPSPGRSRESFADGGDVVAVAGALARFERGELDAGAWRAFRVAHGIYAQRQDGVYMLRIGLPQGLVTSDQLRALSEVTARFSPGSGHVTTRQDLQLHFVRPADLEPALRRLAVAGITTTGCGGNRVRNVVACPLAGVSASEVFDPTPYAEATTRHFLRHPLAASLPRKLKIGFEGCAQDHAATAIQDVGLRARVREGRRGFRVTVGGGTSSACTSGQVIEGFLPAGDVLALAEALVRVFHARGDRLDKRRNRLKFLVSALGIERFRALVLDELARVRAEGAPRLPFDPERPPDETPPPGHRPDPAAAGELGARGAAASPGGPARRPAGAAGAPCPDTFLGTNVARQRQPGYAVVTVSLEQGNVTASQLEALADLSVAHGDGAVRFSPEGHALLRWVRTDDVPALFRGLAAAGLARDGAGSAADVVACPGADACREAVTLTRNVARLVEQRVRAVLGSHALRAPLSVRVSGCPNGCSRHHLAAIGLQGSARKLDGRSVPQYAVLLGGGPGDAGARFGRLAAKVPARRVAEAVERLVGLYLAERAAAESAADFFARSLDRARALLAPLEQLRLEDARAEDFVEPGATERFRPSVQEGECAA